MVSGATTYLSMVHGLWSHIERRALAVIGHMSAFGVQQLAQAKVCRGSEGQLRRQIIITVLLLAY